MPSTTYLSALLRVSCTPDVPKASTDNIKDHAVSADVAFVAQCHAMPDAALLLHVCRSLSNCIGDENCALKTPQLHASQP